LNIIYPLVLADNFFLVRFHDHRVSTPLGGLNDREHHSKIYIFQLLLDDFHAKSVYNEVGCINANAKSFQKIHDNVGDDHDNRHDNVDEDHDNRHDDVADDHDNHHDNVDNMISNIMISVPMVTGTNMTLSTLLHHNYTSYHPPSTSSIR